MFSKLEFMIAIRYLMSKRKEGFISIIAIFSFVGIILGVATLIIVMSVMNGFREELIERMLGMNAHITVYHEDGKIMDYEEHVAEIRQISGIKHANVLVEGQVMASSEGYNSGAMVRGIKKEDLKNKQLIANTIVGDIEKFEGRNNIILGTDLARTLNIVVGERVKLIAPETNTTIIGSIPRMKTYTVVGLFKSGMYEYDSTTIFMPLEAAQIHFKYRNSASAIEIITDNVDNVNKVSTTLHKFYAEKGTAKDMIIVDWQDANASFISALKVERNVMFIILTLIILVAAFNIISSLIMLVNDKAKNIALLRAMGATKGSIMRIFFICGFLIGIVGTFSGTVLGIVLASNIEGIKTLLESMTGASLFDPTIYFLSNLPSKIIPSDIILIVSMSLGLSFLATLYPSYKATKQNPAEVLRYE